MTIDVKDAAGATQNVKTLNDLETYLDQGVTSFPFVATAAFCTDNIKGSAGKLYGFSIVNATTSALYLKLYNKATDPDPSASDTPVARFELPPKVSTVDGQISYTLPVPISFTTGIGFVIVPSLTDNVETALAANDAFGNFYYI